LSPCPALLWWEMAGGWFEAADRAVGAVIALGRWLVLPVSLLLFLQWPLRELVHAYSVEANDLAQWLFALYVSLALTFATRERTHLAADAVARAYSPRTHAAIGKTAALLSVAPWALFVLITGAPTALRSVAQLEKFPETYDPFYFIVKASALLLALLVLLQALLDVLRPSPRR
jgi:TRAP-type mannitol/chloroaromatic compound transport system permease small subunit